MLTKHLGIHTPLFVFFNHGMFLKEHYFVLFYFILMTNLRMRIPELRVCNESALLERKLGLLRSVDFIILLSFMLLRSAASALLRTTAVTPTFCPVSTVSAVLHLSRIPPRIRPFSTSVCLLKKKKLSAWLEVKGQTMDGNIEEILAPLRLAVKEQVTCHFSIIKKN